MSARTVLLFPGLGAYSTGMLRQAAGEHPEVAETFAGIDRAAARHGVPSVARVVLHEEPRPIREMLALPTEVLQLAIFGASVVTHRVLAAAGLRPYALLGHSFGEMAALVAAGAFTLDDGVRLVCARAEALAEWEGRGAMAAIGANEAVTLHLIGAMDEPDLAVGCLNAPRQTVISGPVEAIDRAGRVAKALDLFYAKLHLPYASHHPSARPAVGRFLGLMDGIEQKPLEHKVYSPVHGRWYSDADDLKFAIAECMVLPVRFTDAVRDLHSSGATVFVESGALNALTRCVELTVPGVRTVAPLLDSSDETGGLRRVLTGESDVRPPRTDTASAVVAPVEIPAAREPELGSSAVPDKDTVLAKLRALYAAALEYPEDVLTERALLEAELGVDSLKQTALLSRVVEEFGLPDRPGELRVWELPSLGAIADHVLGAERVRS
ncbi:acyltransferase domain-containing protein [Allokutzneria sp. A3M-2-11 16]|uniref:acyltransferase domain-containing protein n=1 Tax=Allokutzneria sp. A3M-2-11 16 TaxID=2962043 RepID=UPI0020B743D8|nr:acyltransferase domain-containing protein [Allokutzneria sp. A3M-2-11 16]MCP3805265.1 acyltransferase domain-containing protein [Allokutzneria sp. A3M-2-11 16]